MLKSGTDRVAMRRSVLACYKIIQVFVPVREHALEQILAHVQMDTLARIVSILFVMEIHSPQMLLL